MRPLRFVRRMVVRTLFLGAAAAIVVLALLRLVPPPTTAFMVADTVRRAALPDYRWTPASRIAPSLLVAVVAAEDQKFATHSGFDFAAIEDAARHNRHGGSVRGASTISQQVAKNLFLWPGRSWLRKGLEAALTVMLEAMLPKRRILEIYVNVAEFGDGVFGAAAAAGRFFGKEPDALDAAECALLAAVLPNPREYRADRPSPAVRRRQQWIQRQATALGGPAWLKRLP